MPDFNCNTVPDGADGVFELDMQQLDAAAQAELISELTGEMLAAAEALEFERAADLRDRIRSLTGEGRKKKSPKRK